MPGRQLTSTDLDADIILAWHRPSTNRNAAAGIILLQLV
ncbi:hypothetical protein APV28_2242 [Comamonas testosteroni]|nr:hypothetical protein APV28_2242 [Comamonas testosteroni]